MLGEQLPHRVRRRQQRRAAEQHRRPPAARVPLELRARAAPLGRGYAANHEHHDSRKLVRPGPAAAAGRSGARGGADRAYGGAEAEAAEAGL